LLLPLVTIDPNKFPSAADKSNKGCQGDWKMRTARVLTPKTFGRALILGSEFLLALKISIWSLVSFLGRADWKKNKVENKWPRTSHARQIGRNSVGKNNLTLTGFGSSAAGSGRKQRSCTSNPTRLFVIREGCDIYPPLTTQTSPVRSERKAFRVRFLGRKTTPGSTTLTTTPFVLPVVSVGS
jgi:hypothetical protein